MESEPLCHNNVVTHPKLSFESILFLSVVQSSQFSNKTTKIGSPVDTQNHNVNAKQEGQNIIPLY